MTLDYNEFKTWLESKGAEDVVGRARVCRACPMAKYLGLIGHNVVEVTHKFYRAPNGRVASLPGWARGFIKGVDEKGFVEIKAKRALGVLNEIHAA